MMKSHVAFIYRLESARLSCSSGPSALPAGVGGGLDSARRKESETIGRNVASASLSSDKKARQVGIRCREARCASSFVRLTMS
jgi:hypothetical protein